MDTPNPSPALARAAAHAVLLGQFVLALAVAGGCGQRPVCEGFKGRPAQHEPPTGVEPQPPSTNPPGGALD